VRTRNNEHQGISILSNDEDNSYQSHLGQELKNGFVFRQNSASKRGAIPFTPVAPKLGKKAPLWASERNSIKLQNNTQ